MDAQSRELALWMGRHGGATRLDIARHLAVSERTVYVRLRACNEALGDAAAIEFLRDGADGAGYYLVVSDQSSFDALVAADVPGSLPSTPAGRVRYLLNDLLSRSDWVTLDDLSTILYVSRTTLSADLREVERQLECFGLRLVKKPRHGIMVKGPEMARRLCLASAVVEQLEEERGQEGLDISNALGEVGGIDRKLMFDLVARCVSDVLDSEDFQVNSLVYRNLIVHIGIALLRIGEDCHVPVEPGDLSQLREGREFEVASKIAQAIERAASIDLPEEEIAYMAIHLAGKRVLSVDDEDGGMVISDEVWNLVSQMLELVWRVFRFDFRGDIELRMNLARHIVPLAVRLRHHLTMENPLLEDVRARFPLAWSMAADASGVLAAHYGAQLSEAEIGYIALAIALAIERQKTEPTKKNIVIFCASGRGSARFLEHRYREEFGDYLDHIEACDISRLGKMDFSDIDYVFTTVPIDRKLPVPVRQVSFFLDKSDIADVRDVIRGDDRPFAPSVALGYLDEGLFMPHLDARTKEDVLEVLCSAAATRHNLDSTFKELVFKREEIAPTAFGNLVALPHPIEPVSDETFWGVAVLSNAIPWDGHEVQVVFLLSVSRDERVDLEEFYDCLIDVFMDANAIAKLISNQRLETLKEILSKSVS